MTTNPHTLAEQAEQLLAAANTDEWFWHLDINDPADSALIAAAPTLIADMAAELRRLTNEAEERAEHHDWMVDALQAERDEARAALRTLLDAIGDPEILRWWADSGGRGDASVLWLTGLADAAAAVTANPQPRHDTIAARHQAHYRYCDCVGDSCECCDASCPCHASANPQPHHTPENET